MNHHRSLKTAIARTKRNARGYRVFSDTLRRRVSAHALARKRSGVSFVRTAKKLGVGDALISRWVRQSAAKSTPTKRRMPRLKPVVITDESTDVIVRGLHGVVVEGLDIEQLAVLLRALA